MLRYETDRRGGPGAVINQIVEGVRQLKQETAISLSGIGIGVAGQVDPGTGGVIFAPNLDWHNVPLGADLEKECALPVVVTNDVRAAMWGEWLFGAGRRRRRFAVYLCRDGNRRRDRLRRQGARRVHQHSRGNRTHDGRP